MVKHKHKSKPVDFKTFRRGMAVPKQSLPLAEIVRRFVKRIPVEVNTQEPVYNEGVGGPLESIARMGNADRAYHAFEHRAATEALKKEAEARTKEVLDEDKRIADEKAAKEKLAKASAGIDSLDNTMPDDTEPDHQDVRPVSKKKSK